ncbi:cupin domain-containing protein [Rhizobium sp. LCM 4573]|uniref:cupin domain-containing protein n=1 Tax=Rhizobium sp. LCM 4573 TaxID=1848291 RepID=UPI0008D91FEA|nr:cupin domain-containing protein [Rhizobium sp. LCM 4573]OHV75626.1 cupin [Rhizobium sp. LCM 4573]
MSADRGDTYHLLGNLIRFHVRPPENGGYCMVEVRSAPGAGAPPNRHPEDDEVFYVLEGEYAFRVGEENISARPGDCVKVPNGAVHAFRNVGQAPARMLVINSPGRIHEAFFSEAGELVPDGTTDFPPRNTPPDIPRVLEIGARNGMEFLVEAGDGAHA